MTKNLRASEPGPARHRTVRLQIHSKDGAAVDAHPARQPNPRRSQQEPPDLGRTRPETRCSVLTNRRSAPTTSVFDTHAVESLRARSSRIGQGMNEAIARDARHRRPIRIPQVGFVFKVIDRPVYCKYRDGELIPFKGWRRQYR